MCMWPNDKLFRPVLHINFRTEALLGRKSLASAAEGFDFRLSASGLTPEKRTCEKESSAAKKEGQSV
jgi:hypothetical protein